MGLLLLICCLLLLPLFVGVLCVVCYLLFGTLCPSSIAIILMGKRELVAFIYSSRCPVTVIVLWRILKMPWVGLQCVIVVFPDHTYLLLWIDPVGKGGKFHSA